MLQVSFPSSWQKGFFISNPGLPEIVPSFENEEQYLAAIKARDEGIAVDMYPRESSKSLFDVEARVAEYVRIQPSDVLVYNTGMAAVEGAIDVALDETFGDKPQVLACSNKPFKSTKWLMENRIARRGVEIVWFDAGDKGSVDETIQEHRPDVVVLETVGNGIHTPLADIDHLQEAVAQHTPESVIVYDNTLPTSTSLPLSSKMSKDVRSIGVESLIKSYGLNKANAGAAYTPNPDLLKVLRSYRNHGGTPLIGANVEQLQLALPNSIAEFDARNTAVQLSAGTLAVHLAEAEREGADFSVSHPALPSHANYEYGREHYKNGISPVLFLECRDGTDKVELSKRLRTASQVDGQIQLRPSFGFDGSCIIPNEISNGVRITGGAEVDSRALGQALKEAALRK